MSKIGQILWKNGLFLPWIFEWMTIYGSEKSFLPFFSAKDDKCFMEIGCSEVPKPTYPSLLWLAEWKVPAPFFFGHGARISGQLDYISNWQLKVQW